MEKKENVYEETNATENITQVTAETREQVGLPQEDSTVAGKFKDVNALVRAYESLQAEFTRRSQRLKELEKLAENPKMGTGAAENSGAEKLRKNAESRREKAKAFDEFVLDVNRAHGQTGPDGDGESPAATEAKNADENAKETVNGQVRIETMEELGEKKAEREGVDELKSAHPSVAGNVPSAEDLYLQVCRDEAVRLRIIGEYLTSVGRSAPPITAAGGGTFVSPPRKAKNIGDAAMMALQYLKKP